MSLTPGLFFRDEGQGAPVLLVHGLAAQTRVFDDLIALGAGRYRFLSVDLPRSGRSDAWASSTPAAIADGLGRWLLQQRVPQVTVCGHSFGGLVAIELAARFPAVVKRLVVASAPALGLPPALSRLLGHRAADWSLPLLQRLPALRPAVRAYFQLIWGERTRLTERHVDIYLEALEARQVWQGMLDAGRAIAAYRLPLAALAAAAVPTAVLWGDRDPLVPVLQGERLAGTLRGSFAVLARTGHCVPEERPEALLAAL